MSAIGMHTSSTKFQHLPGQSITSAEGAIPGIPGIPAERGSRGFERAELSKKIKSFIVQCFLLFQNWGVLLNQKF